MCRSQWWPETLVVLSGVGPVAPELLVFQLFAGPTAIRILIVEIDKVPLAQATPCLKARGRRFGKRRGDAGLVACQDFLAAIW